MKSLSPVAIFAVAFSLIGIIVLAVSVFICLRTIYTIENGIEIEAEITGVSSRDGRRQSFVVKYTVDGQTYQENLGFYSAFSGVGDKIEIRYDKDNVTDISVAELEFLAFGIMCATGSLLLIVGVILFVILLNRALLKHRLKRNGRRTDARIVSAEYNRLVEINGSNPVRVVCEDTDGHQYKSPNLPYHAELFTVGDYIDLYTDRYRQKKYYIDIESYVKNKNINTITVQ